MSESSHTHSADAVVSKHPSSQPADTNSDAALPQSATPSSVQRARLARHLTPQDVLQLQRLIGNQAVGRLLTQTAQHQPIAKLTQQPTMGKAIIQRRISGLGPDAPLGERFLALNFTLLGVEDGDKLQEYLDELKACAPILWIREGYPLSFNTENKVLLIRAQQIKELEDYAKKRLRGEEISDAEHQAAITTVANLAHELSHARDYMLQKAKMDELHDPVLRVMYTELKAWAIEAVTAAQLKSRARGPEGVELDAGKEQLINGWRTIDPAKIQDTYAVRSSNELLRRFWTYLSRELKPTEPRHLDEHITHNRDWYVARLTTLKDFVVKEIG